MKCKDEGSKETSIDHDVVIFVPVYKILNAIRCTLGEFWQCFKFGICHAFVRENMAVLFIGRVYAGHRYDGVCLQIISCRCDLQHQSCRLWTVFAWTEKTMMINDLWFINLLDLIYLCHFISNYAITNFLFRNSGRIYAVSCDGSKCVKIDTIKVPTDAMGSRLSYTQLHLKKMIEKRMPCKQVCQTATPF